MNNECQVWNEINLLTAAIRYGNNSEHKGSSTKNVEMLCYVVKSMILIFDSSTAYETGT